MRSLVLAAVAVLALLAGPASKAGAQETGNSAQGPAAPIPYPFLKPPPRQAPKRPAPHRPAKPPTEAPASGPASAPPTSPTTGGETAAPPSAASSGQPRPPASPARPASTAPAPPPSASPGARLAPGQPLPSPELQSFVDGVVASAMARDRLAGVAVAVVQDGRAILDKGYGFASFSPERRVDPDRTLFRLGPVSETFTWIALMREVEAGRIGLDQPVNIYLPERVQVRDQGFDRPVRIRNLMDHSAGFEDRSLGRIFERDPAQVRPLEVYLREERPRRVRPPGEVASFTAYDAALAGEAAARTAGKPFERLVEDEILRPLGLAHTTFLEPRPEAEGLPPPMPGPLAAEAAQGYRWSSGGWELRPYEYAGQIAPAMSASSTASDMARYMLALLGGGQLNGAVIYGPRTAQAFRTPGPGASAWAHGMRIYRLPGERLGYGAGGRTLAFHTSLVVAPDLDLGVFVSVNSAGGESLADGLPSLIVRAFYAAPIQPPRPGSPQLGDTGDVFQGYYLSTRRAYGGLEGFAESLSRGAKVTVSPEGRLLVAGSGQVAVWVPDGDPSGGRFIASQGERRLAFDIADGRARAFHAADGEASFERASVWRRPLVLAWLGGLSAAAALATLAGLIARNRRDQRETQIQGRASLFQNIQAGLWLFAMALFAAWIAGRGDSALMFRWPSPLLVTASACALVAAALTIATIVVLPGVWRGGRRVDSWTTARKAAFSFTVLLYAVFSATLAVWGALLPWSS